MSGGGVGVRLLQVCLHEPRTQDIGIQVFSNIFPVQGFEERGSCIYHAPYTNLAARM